MERTLAIDFGQARIGLAISDDLGMMAHPLETVKTKENDHAKAIERIVDLVEERDVTLIVLGLPLTLGGDEGSAVETVREFSKELDEAFDGDMDIVEQDERNTTVAAAEKLREAGKNAKNSKNKIDMAAAVEILQAYLDAQEQAGMKSEEESESLGKSAKEDADWALWDDDDDDDLGGYSGGYSIGAGGDDDDY